ncbi:MAG: hypothetical protein ISS63_07575 [Desulfobacteraceae bacterium]|nr:hypothetical protein [Desulfobacteraceae bacterium]
MNFRRKPFNSRFDAFEKPLPVSFGPKQVLPGIASVHHVIEGDRVFYSAGSCHGRGGL